MGSALVRGQRSDFLALLASGSRENMLDQDFGQTFLGDQGSKSKENLESEITIFR